MTTDPIDTEALRKQYAHLVEKYGPEAWAESRAHVVLSLLDALATAEHRATRAEAQSAIRGRAVVVYRERAQEAEAKLRAAEAFVEAVKALVEEDDRRIIGEIVARKHAPEGA